MPDIVLTTLNARYAHASFGLRYLLANLGELAERAAILEFDINQRPIDVLESILAHNPMIVGLGVYIWNVAQATILAADLKRLRPDITLILGGPEVGFETDQQEIARTADYVICGEADLAFADLCGKLLSGRRPDAKIIQAELPQFVGSASADRLLASSPEQGSGFGVQGSGEKATKRRSDEATKGVEAESGCSAGPIESPIANCKSQIANPLQLPYHLYTDADIAHRVIYVEASRGCPFHCEFCLSSLDVPVRNVPLDAFLNAMQRLLDHGVRQFKFVDRTFNLNLNIGRAILDFFWERYRPGLFLHFEMIPDRLPEALREPIRRFPPGALQFEVGIQTFNEDVAKLISRRQDNAKVEANLRFLREQTGVHVHADLIAGLPGEDLASFAAGFDRLVALRPQEIQLGILKRLRGTPIARHDQTWQMIYSPHPPYEVLQTRLIDFPTMQRLRRFARYWDMLANSGNFVETMPLIWRDASPFASFMALADWLFTRTKRTHAIALNALGELLFEYLTAVARRDPAEAASAMAADYHRTGRRDVPEF